MALTLRRTVPCGHCLGQPTCATVWHELQNTVERLNWFAEAHGMNFSEIDLILDCHSYSPPERQKRPSTGQE